MGLLVWFALGCGAVGAALLLWCEWKLYRARLVAASEVWWVDGVHDEVETYPRKLFGDRGDGGEW